MAKVIVQYLNEFHDACQYAGLKVLITDHAMGANVVTPLKLLSATKTKQKKHIETFFKFHNQETATVPDPPHFLKCTWNLFLKQDVHLKSSIWATNCLLLVSGNTY
jgi:hypothetical protein